MIQMAGSIPVWGDPIDEGALAQLRLTQQHPDVNGVAMMADHHLGYGVPIGGVVAYNNSISPTAVGYDIGCGNKAVLLGDVSAQYVQQNIGSIMDEIVKRISFGMGRNNGVVVDHPMFDRSNRSWYHPAVQPLKRMAQNQLGTVGGGNHYVDIFIDEEQHVWVGVHFGSRGLGHKIATWFLKAGGAKDAINAEPLVLSLDSALGQEYEQCMQLAGEYAYAGRDWVCDEVARIIGADIISSVHNNHNFAWSEAHYGKSLIVHRKGATPAHVGQTGFIGGSMGDPAYIVMGREARDGGMENRLSYYSTVHGAGRAMSRTKAKGKTNRRTGEIISPGVVSQDMMDAWMKLEGVELRGADLDEAPQAYKRIEEVMSHHSNTLAIIRTLQPIGVAMAGRDIIDPFKD